MKTYQGRAVIPGRVTGKVLVSRQGFNVLASYAKALTSRGEMTACNDQNNQALYQKELKGSILCIPQFIGSTTAGMLLQSVAAMGVQPKAMLFFNTADSLAISGVLLSDIWEDVKIITVDRLGEEFLQTVNEGQEVEIREDGTVVLL